MPVRIRSRLIAGRFEPVDAILECRILQISSALDRVIEALQAQFGLGGAPVQLGDVFAPPV